jgi:hypothetical protein
MRTFGRHIGGMPGVPFFAVKNMHCLFSMFFYCFLLQQGLTLLDRVVTIGEWHAPLHTIWGLNQGLGGQENVFNQQKKTKYCNFHGQLMDNYPREV